MKDKQTIIKTFLEKIYKQEIKNQKYYTFGYQQDYRKKENYDFGYIPFVTGLKFNEIENIIPKTNPNNRCGELKESTEYIVVHDTASGAPSAGAKAHENWLMSMATNPESTYSVSWHFTVDEENIINHLPIDEVGYHAGDGTAVKLTFTDTNVKADRPYPAIIGDDGYFYINGKKTTIEVPLKEDGTKITNEELPYQGINTIIGENGNYFISNVYFNKSYGVLSNKGGNLNSVGIETCVNFGKDYIKTMRLTAYLVAKLLKIFNLGLDRVKQHNSFSGKDCPMTIRHANRWEEFLELVDLNLYYLNNLSDMKVEFKSLTPEYLNDEGKVIKHKDNEKIRYSVKIDDETYEFESVLMPLTFEL